MRRALVVVALLAAGACPRPAPSSIPPASPDSGRPSPEPRTADATKHQRPAAGPPRAVPAPNLHTLRDRAAALASAAKLTGHAPGPAPALGSKMPGVTRITGRWYPRPDVPQRKVPYLVDRIELLFSTAPWSTVEGRDLVVRFATRVPTEAAVVYFGLRLEADPIAPPRYREYAVESRKRAGTAHEVRLPLDELLDPRLDVDGVVARGFGEVAWQVELPYPGSGSTVLFDGRLALRIDGESLVPQPTVVLGPLVHQITESNAVVSFETSAPVTAVVGAGPDTIAESAVPATRHEILVTGLHGNTRYPYRVVISDGSETSVAPLRTLTTPGSGPLTVAILSDSRSDVGPGMLSYNGVNATVLQTFFTAAYRDGAQAIFFPGDLADGYTAHVDDYQWQLRAWLKVIEGVHGHVPVYTGMGNHEALVDVWNDGVVLDKAGSDSAEARFAAIMVNPKGAPGPEAPEAPPYDETVYAVDIQGVHFVMLNTNYWYTRNVGHARLDGKGNREGVLMDGQLRWLEADLAAARQRGVAHIVVMGHEPAFPAGGHTKDGMWWNGALPEVNAVRERFWRLLAEYRVLAYVAGDEHNYSRARIGPETVAGAAASVYSIISGGCGAPYYALSPPPQYADRIQTFSAEQNYTLWTFEPDALPRLRVYGLTGDLIDDVRLDPG